MSSCVLTFTLKLYVAIFSVLLTLFESLHVHNVDIVLASIALVIIVGGDDQAFPSFWLRGNYFLLGTTLDFESTSSGKSWARSTDRGTLCLW